LAHLEETSEKMLEAITETVELIQVNIDKVANVNTSVTDITNDATALGENIKVVDSAVKEVETSNKTLVDNMTQVCEIMEVMTKSIDGADVTTKTMLSKYDESVRSATSIENVVGNLMEELGVGGFMGVADVNPGMKLAIAFNDDGETKEYTGDVVKRSDNEVFISVKSLSKDISEKRKMKCQLRIVVDNVLYSWETVDIYSTKDGEPGNYKLVVVSNPKVFNRRKYPRMPLANACVIKVKETDTTYNGRMVNISANGFAFAVKDEFFEDPRGKNVIVSVAGFDVIGDKDLEGCIIRSSNNSGQFIVGCRMPEDSKEIKEYVSQNYSE